MRIHHAVLSFVIVYQYVFFTLPFLYNVPLSFHALSFFSPSCIKFFCTCTYSCFLLIVTDYCIPILFIILSFSLSEDKTLSSKQHLLKKRSTTSSAPNSCTLALVADYRFYSFLLSSQNTVITTIVSFSLFVFYFFIFGFLFLPFSLFSLLSFLYLSLKFNELLPIYYIMYVHVHVHM